MFLYIAGSKIWKQESLNNNKSNWTLVDIINDQLSQLNTAVADRRKYATVMKKIDWNRVCWLFFFVLFFYLKNLFYLDKF